MEYDTYHYNKDTDTTSGGQPDSKLTSAQAITITIVGLVICLGLYLYFEAILDLFR